MSSLSHYQDMDNQEPAAEVGEKSRTPTSSTKGCLHIMLTVVVFLTSTVLAVVLGRLVYLHFHGLPATEETQNGLPQHLKDQVQARKHTDSSDGSNVLRATYATWSPHPFEVSEICMYETLIFPSMLANYEPWLMPNKDAYDDCDFSNAFLIKNGTGVNLLLDTYGGAFRNPMIADPDVDCKQVQFGQYSAPFGAPNSMQCTFTKAGTYYFASRERSIGAPSCAGAGMKVKVKVNKCKAYGSQAQFLQTKYWSYNVYADQTIKKGSTLKFISTVPHNVQFLRSPSGNRYFTDAEYMAEETGNADYSRPYKKCLNRTEWGTVWANEFMTPWRQEEFPQQALFTWTPTEKGHYYIICGYGGQGGQPSHCDLGQKLTVHVV